MAETTGERIRQLRGKMSQEEFASQLGVHEQTLGKYERDKIVPGGDVLARMYETLGADITWLLTGKGQMRPGGSEALAPAPTSSSAAIDADLYGLVTEAVSAAYKECGYTAALRDIAAEAAKIAADLSEDVSPEDRPAAIRGAIGQLRRRLREAIANPNSAAAGTQKA